MAAIRIKFPRAGFETSTWVEDEHWASLSPKGRDTLIRRFVKLNYPHLLRSYLIPPASRHPYYEWSEI